MLASFQDVVNMHVEAMSDSDCKKRCAFQIVSGSLLVAALQQFVCPI